MEYPNFGNFTSVTSDREKHRFNYTTGLKVDTITCLSHLPNYPCCLGHDTSLLYFYTILRKEPRCIPGVKI